MAGEGARAPSDCGFFFSNVSDERGIGAVLSRSETNEINVAYSNPLSCFVGDAKC